MELFRVCMVQRNCLTNTALRTSNLTY